MALHATRRLAAADGVNMLVTSYQTLARDNELGAPSRRWHYVVLDEGHLIQNPKSARATAVKRLIAQHRLVLTGTPVQVGGSPLHPRTWCSADAYIWRALVLTVRVLVPPPPEPRRGPVVVV